MSFLLEPLFLLFFFLIQGHDPLCPFPDKGRQVLQGFRRQRTSRMVFERKSG